MNHEYTPTDRKIISKIQNASEYKPGALVFLKEEFFFICKMDSVEHPQCIQYQG